MLHLPVPHLKFNDKNEDVKSNNSILSRYVIIVAVFVYVVSFTNCGNWQFTNLVMP